VKQLTAVYYSKLHRVPKKFTPYDTHKTIWTIFGVAYIYVKPKVCELSFRDTLHAFPQPSGLTVRGIK